MNGSAWDRDWILSKCLRAIDGELRPISGLDNPLKIIVAEGRATVAFDYAFFVLLRSLCGAIVSDGDVDGALVSAYLYQVGLRLNGADLEFEAASVLNRACELRTRYTLFDASSRREAFLYQKAINICLIHETTHLSLARSPSLKDYWLKIADASLAYIDDDRRSESFFPDATIRDDIRKTCRYFRSDAALLEEVACDLFSLQNSISQELTSHPGLASLYADGYLVAARLAIIALYMARTIARAAALAVHGIVGFQGDAGSPAIENQSFLSEMRLRVQVIVLRALVIRDALGLPPFRSDTDEVVSPIDANNLPFDRLMLSLQLELQACREDDSLFRAIALAKGIRKFQLYRGPLDNLPLIDLFLEGHWG